MTNTARLAIAALGLALFLPALALAASTAADRTKEGCDYAGFDQPCEVTGGTYRVLLPKGDGPFPVLLYLYGSGGHSVDVTDHPILQQTVVDRGYALVVPEALDILYYGAINDTGWTLHTDTKQNRDEAAFLRRVLDDATTRFRLDRDRVLIAGQSRGGFLTWELACNHPELAAGFAVNGGGYLEPLPSRCKVPVRLIVTHGLTDGVVPIQGAPPSVGETAVPPLMDELNMMARSEGCKDSDAGEDRAFYSFGRRSWVDCMPGASLDLMLHPGGHVMPLIWFRAILDWFEETPTVEASSKPVVRSLGTDRPSGQFKGVPAAGAKRIVAPTQ